MMRVIWISVGLMFGLGLSLAEAADPFDGDSKWRVEESWHGNVLEYTFDAGGTFKSSDWDDGKGFGSWVVDGDELIMMWPRYERAIYRGRITGNEIVGTAHWQGGKELGTFTFRLVE